MRIVQQHGHGEPNQTGLHHGDTDIVADVDIRVLSDDDWQLWRELRLAALTDAPDAFGSTLAQWSGPGDTEQRWRARLADAALNLFALHERTSVTMASMLRPDAHGLVEITSLWVAPTARGRGVADSLLTYIEQWRRTTYPHTSTVLEVKTTNSAALALYRRNGFSDAGMSPDDPTELLLHRCLPN